MTETQNEVIMAKEALTKVDRVRNNIDDVITMIRNCAEAISAEEIVHFCKLSEAHRKTLTKVLNKETTLLSERIRVNESVFKRFYSDRQGLLNTKKEQYAKQRK